MSIDGADETGIHSVERSMFSFKGRASRRDFWFNVVVPASIIYYGLAFLFSWLITNELRHSGELKGPAIVMTLIIMGPLSIFYLWIICAATVRRLHDQNMSSWWLLVCFMPVFGWLFHLYVSLRVGSNGENRYGNPQGTS